MKQNFNKLIGNDLPIEHRFLNIALIFSIFLAAWSSVTNILLNLDRLLIGACVLSTIILSGFYYLSRIKRQYSLPAWLVTLLAILIVPIAWITNEGISGSIPFYVILFSSIAAVALFGRRRIALIIYFAVISAILIACEYYDPSLVIAYPGVMERYADIGIGLLTTLFCNTVIILLILKYYSEEHEKAENYLKQSLVSQEKLLYLSYHDILTGLYNRTYFEKRIAELAQDTTLKVGIFGIDLDNLKFVNDLLGHEHGDLLIKRAAKILKASFSSEAMIARVGGDEFIVLVPNLRSEDMEPLYKRIYKQIQKENEAAEDLIIPLKMSVGYVHGYTAEKSLGMLRREADHNMYCEKLHHKSETDGTLLQIVKKMHLNCGFLMNEPDDSRQNLVIKFARAAALPEAKLGEFQLFAEFHDIGTVGIDRLILHKTTPLTLEEQKQIKRHCEIGFRIARTSRDLLPIADLILRHHEWWNGTGYPLGLQGEHIPLECRLIAIIDAYESMTHDRPYRQALRHEDAVKELQKMAGVQFDSRLVDLFVQQLSSQPNFK